MKNLIHTISRRGLAGRANRTWTERPGAQGTRLCSFPGFAHFDIIKGTHPVYGQGAYESVSSPLTIPTQTTIE